MKKLIFKILVFCLGGAAHAQSNLPPCKGGADRFGYVSTASWNNCFGTWKDPGQNATYVGEWRNGKQNGQGKMTSIVWEYIGEWKNGRENGQGSFVSLTTKYVGEFKDGAYSGRGVLYDKFTGKVLKEGLWANGSLQRSIESAPEVAKLREEVEQALMSAAKSSNHPAPPQAKAMPAIGNRRALIIGNDLYRSIAKLENAREDARTIAANLTALGYQVTLKLDLNEREMKSALRAFSNQVQGGDEVIFFFAGHGVQLGAANYLLPTDIAGESEAQVRDEAIQLQRVLDDMAERKAKFTLAMIDACRDNPFKTTGRAIGGRGLAPTTAATGQMVIFSAGSGQQALDRLNSSDQNKNGLFTRILVKEMQKPNVSIDRVIKNVRSQVAELAKSVGHEQVPAIYDQVLGDFYFVK